MLTKEFIKQDVSHFLSISHPSHFCEVVRKRSRILATLCLKNSRYLFTHDFQKIRVSFKMGRMRSWSAKVIWRIFRIKFGGFFANKVGAFSKHLNSSGIFPVHILYISITICRPPYIYIYIYIEIYRCEYILNLNTAHPS